MENGQDLHAQPGGKNAENSEVKFAPVTLRAKQSTREFFAQVDEYHAILKASAPDATKADAANYILANLLNLKEQMRALNEHAEVLEKEIAELRKLEAISKPEQSEQGIVLTELQGVVNYSKEQAEMLDYVIEQRKLKYKKEVAETREQVLIGCMFCRPHIFNFNNTFYTGLTKEDSK